MIDDIGEFVDPQQQLVDENVLEAPVAACRQLVTQLQSVGWKVQEIIVLGHGQGGTVALNVGFCHNFNAVLSIGGPVLQAAIPTHRNKLTTKLYLAVPPSLRTIMDEDCQPLRELYDGVELRYLQHDFPRTKVTVSRFCYFDSTDTRLFSPYFSYLS